MLNVKVKHVVRKGRYVLLIAHGFHVVAFFFFLGGVGGKGVRGLGVCVCVRRKKDTERRSMKNMGPGNTEHFLFF